MLNFAEAKSYLAKNQHSWLVTGCAGFIGSNLLEFLLENNQKVIGIDNFSTGKRENLQDVQKLLPLQFQDNFKFYEGDICNLDLCKQATQDVDYILHQAALGSVPRSIKDPLNSHNSNVNGQLNILIAAKEAQIKKVVYASSSSVYGDHPELPKKEENIGEQLSPYAVTKHVNELYGKVFTKVYDLNTVGIRYFNVFGKRQDPDSIYAAVIPKWVKALIDNDDVFINGDGKTSRDFCYIDNVIQMNILAALSENEESNGAILNCACNSQTDLNTLFELLKERLAKFDDSIKDRGANYRDFRPGDVRHSNADITKASKLINYQPEYFIEEGLDHSINWYYENLK